MKTTHFYNRIIESRLKECGVHNISALMSILIKTQSVIAGSFPLQCILGEHYDNSDIDIFCLGTDRDTCDKIMIENHGVYPALCEIDKYIYSTYSKKGQPNKYIVDGILRSKIYNITDKLCFNVIQVAYKPIEFVKNTFDFTFCQTIFDGNNVHFYPLTLQKIGWRAHALLPRYKPKKNYHSAHPKNPAKKMLDIYNARLSKYQTRGFAIYDINSIAHLKLLFQECEFDETILPNDSLQLSPQLVVHNNNNDTNDNNDNDDDNDADDNNDNDADDNNDNDDDDDDKSLMY